MICKICSETLQPGKEFGLRVGHDIYPLKLRICRVCGVAEIPDDHPIFDPGKISKMRGKLIPTEGFEGFFAIYLPQSDQVKTAENFAVYCRKCPPVGEPSNFSQKHMVRPEKLLPLQQSPSKAR